MLDHDWRGDGIGVPCKPRQFVFWEKFAEVSSQKLQSSGRVNAHSNIEEDAQVDEKEQGSTMVRSRLSEY